ncbi:unnamed protein product [Vitrella brassicaformis CCMP3155]|uniref:Uncharacterized protein n=1 Tax=Vitrella brassicaformis (strain CCMP3155) TaxID=1169540 RepID=A0A0G4H1I2_VITBC|nr:unnamed protein product [Vitrella brassicaformis CCMP3155]|eukprot:CEM37218.1 unnamed protein product [Vitrella brassicaformis CCMP3155]
MLVGRHVAFQLSGGQQDGNLEMFCHNNEIRIIRNEPNFTLTLNPPLPLPTSRPIHPFSQHPFTHHAKPHDPPVRSRIVWHTGVGWATCGVSYGAVVASASSLMKKLMLAHRLMAVSGFTDSPAVVVDRGARGGHLNSIITQSPHTPLAECPDVMALELVNGACAQLHVLTTSDDPFIAWITFLTPPGDSQNVSVHIRTTEAPAAGMAHDAPFAHRFPLTAAKVRLAFGPIGPIVLDGEAP